MSTHSSISGAIGPQHLEQAVNTEFDLIVVGGGITGCWATLLAAQRGLKVCLVEAGDFGSGTSRVSHRILHGGFRYLQRMDLSRLRESVIERRHYFREFPDLVSPLPCLMPLYGEGLKSPLPFKAAALAYSALSMGQNKGVEPLLRLPSGGVLSADQTQAIFELVRTEGLQGGGVWHDGLMLSHPRIIMTILRRAASLGAVCLNHNPAVELLTDNNSVTGVRVQQHHQAIELKAARILNTAGTSAGTWAAQLSGEKTPLVNPALAFNLLIDRPPVSTHGVAVTPPKSASNTEPRTYFLVPRAGCISAGTLHRSSRTDAIPEVSAEMVQSMIEDLNAAIPGLDLTPEGVIRVDAGMVPTDASGDSEPSDRPTVIDHSKTGGPDGLVSAIAVKYTTARHTASSGLKLAFGQPSGSPKSESQSTPDLPLALLLNPDPSADEVLDHAAALKAFCDAEGVTSLTDLVLGRTEWGELPVHSMKLAEPLSDLLAGHFGWDPERKQSELESLAHALPGSLPKMG